MTNWQNDSRKVDWQKGRRIKPGRQTDKKSRQTGWQKVRPTGWHLKLDRQAQGWQRQADGHIDRQETDRQHCKGNSVYIFLFWELRGLSPNFYIHVSVSDLNIPSIGPHISSSRNGSSIVGIYNTLTDAWMWKLGLRPRYSFSGNICFQFSAFFLCSEPICQKARKETLTDKRQIEGQSKQQRGRKYGKRANAFSKCFQKGIYVMWIYSENLVNYDISEFSFSRNLSNDRRPTLKWALDGIFLSL